MSALGCERSGSGMTPFSGPQRVPTGRTLANHSRSPLSDGGGEGVRGGAATANSSASQANPQE
ncbi:hypothetical protein GGTG_01283 [Gaeumannomyces tritici R3-111a-1]|uniref:Uncharacterized protein n=1 Tax=Gaeumannomyces tritici (strain R3-111a-1) TaxID=644352 RepID=J3NJ50_GAET3|nr:hypothetical protein GGTG_01283 [Gaeumannomyces tritici R3-111a-1]EJT81300.1 hypothetical protein GGTG_01283 [Gaeumannomyces tritici R3-111a-1]